MIVAPSHTAGVIDRWGGTADGHRTLLCGWIGNPWAATITGQVRLSLIGTARPSIITAVGMLFTRADVASIGRGILLLCDTPPAMIEGLSHIDVDHEVASCRLRAAHRLCHETEDALRDLVRTRSNQADPLEGSHALSALPTCSRLSSTSAMAAAMTIDSVIDCRAAGVLVLGTLSAPEPFIDGLSLEAHGIKTAVGKDHIVLGAMKADHGGLPSASFVCRLAGFNEDAASASLTLRLTDGRSARVALPAAAPGDRGSLLVALAAIENVSAFDDAFDNIMGPAIAALDARDSARGAGLRRIDFGKQPAKPRVSLIIPLHKRIDYLEVQLGLFCGQAGLDGAEILFVVDDPPRQQEAETLAASAYARFGQAFQLLLPSRNLGFARASNAGLHAASGQYVCFLNSDVFPNSPDWMPRLIDGLSHAGIGIMAPMLLFPDGSVQHRGMALVALDRFAGWHFPQHIGKGMRPDGAGIVRVPAVTGACMVMARKTACALGGFDEGFIIGDFEDSDLCLRAAQAGFGAAVDLDVRAIHLERQSQGAEAPWRMGATLYNAWRHERRWFPTERALAAPVPAKPRLRRG